MSTKTVECTIEVEVERTVKAEHDAFRTVTIYINGKAHHETALERLKRTTKDAPDTLAEWVVRSIGELAAENAEGLDWEEPEKDTYDADHDR